MSEKHGSTIGFFFKFDLESPQLLSDLITFCKGSFRGAGVGGSWYYGDGMFWFSFENLPSNTIIENGVQIPWYEYGNYSLW